MTAKVGNKQRPQKYLFGGKANVWLRVVLKTLGFSRPDSNGRKQAALVKWINREHIKIREDIVEPNRASGRRVCNSIEGEMTYTPQHVANYFLDRASAENISLSQMKLIKLVYIAYGWILALTGKRLFEEAIQAWRHGPVIPSLYHEFKHNRAEPICEPSVRYDMDTEEFSVPRISVYDEETGFILEKVWASYKMFSGSSLRAKTHEANTPWSKVFVPDTNGILIRDEDIEQHYKERIRKYLDAAQH
jgi:uncharacterized phage-associated protein